ncbi:hypothetical protein VPH35_126688 [Triticum aestivum]
MEVASSVIRLGQLMCLYVHSCMRLPDGIGNLVSLEMLYNMKVIGTNAIAKELGNLVELRSLGIWWVGEDESKLCSLSIDHVGDARFDFCWDSWVPCPHLHNSGCKWDAPRAAHFCPLLPHSLWGRPANTYILFLLFTRCTSTLPRWINASLFPILSYLHIVKKGERRLVEFLCRRSTFRSLGKLPALRFLRLETTIAQYTPVERFIIGDDAFPFLREGRFGNFLTGPSMFPQGSMPRLESLQFRARASHIADGDLDVYMGHLH